MPAKLQPGASLRPSVSFRRVMDPSTAASHTKLPETTPVVRFRGLLRTHVLDWIQLFIGIVIFGLLQLPQPFKRYVDHYTLEDNAYPHGHNTVPSFAVPIIGLLIPITFFFGVFIVHRKKADLHHSILGVCTAVVLTGIITDSLKLSLGRPRPDFLFRCFPDGKPVFAANGDVVCNGIKSVIREGRKSFPSGHSSWAFAGLGYLSFYMAGKMRVFSGHEGQTAPMLASFLPLVGAAAVGITRINDYMHHWTDVVVGGLLGLACALLIYRHHFPQLKEPISDVYPGTYEGMEIVTMQSDVEMGGSGRREGNGAPEERNN